MSNITSEPVVIHLSRPCLVHGEPISQLVFNEPLGRHLRQVGSSTLADGSPDTQWSYRLAAECCRVPPSTIDDLPVVDAIEVIRVLGRFLESPEVAPSKLQQGAALPVAMRAIEPAST